MGTCCVVNSETIDNENILLISKKEQRNFIKETYSKFSLSKKDTNVNEDIHCDSIDLSNYSKDNEIYKEVQDFNFIKENFEPIESNNDSGFINKDDYEISECICQTRTKPCKVSKKKSCKSVKRFKKKNNVSIKDDKYHPQSKKSLKRIRMKLLTN